MALSGAQRPAPRLRHPPASASRLRGLRIQQRPVGTLRSACPRQASATPPVSLSPGQARSGLRRAPGVSDPRPPPAGHGHSCCRDPGRGALQRDRARGFRQGREATQAGSGRGAASEAAREDISSIQASRGLHLVLRWFINSVRQSLEYHSARWLLIALWALTLGLDPGPSCRVP